MQTREKDTDDTAQTFDKEIEGEVEGMGSQSSIFGSASGADSNGDEQAKHNPYLPTNLQKNAEKALGIGLSNVNIYKNSTDAQTLGAQAFTQGNSIHFAPGMFNPYSNEGQELIVHELIHIAQQNPANSDGTKNDLGAAEIQADALIEQVLSGNRINESLEKVPFNSLQLKPDFTLPPDYSTLELSYFVFVTHNCTKDQFAEIIANQVYRNKDVKIEFKHAQESYLKGSVRSVEVSLDSFLDNILYAERLANEKSFEVRKPLLERYLVEKWLLRLGKNNYKLNYGEGPLNQGAIEQNQDQLITELRSILINGISQSVNEVNIPSYNRSHYNSTNPNDDKDVAHYDSFTSRERSKAIEDHIFRYMPFEDQQDYIEFIYHSIPNSDQSAGISYRYYYFDPSTENYISSLQRDLPIFDPYTKISSAPTFKFAENTISISYQTTKISNDENTSDITETFSVVKAAGKVKITNGNLFTDSFTINSKELLLDPGNYAKNVQNVLFRDRAVVELPQKGGVLLERKRREKKLYENLRHRNAVSHLQEIQDYYGDESNFLKIREDFNRFFTKANLSVITALSPSEQFTFLYLLEQLSSTNDLTFGKLKDLITGFRNLFNIEISGIENATSIEQLTLALSSRQNEIVRKDEKNDKVRKEVYENYTNSSTDAELNKIVDPPSLPFEIKNELALIEVLIAFIKSPSTKTEYLKSILNQQISEKLLIAEYNSNSSNSELELMRKVMLENDDKTKLKYLKELIKSIVQFSSIEPWVKVLSEAKDFNQFKEGIEAVPDETIREFFNKILDGSLLESVVSEQKETVGILNTLRETKAIQAPLQRMNNEVENFIKNEGLDEINLKRIDAVFYPGHEGMYEEANFVEPIPLNLYYYTKNEVRYIVLFIDNGKEVSSKSLEAPGEDEILTHGLLKYIDQQKILGQGIMYYIDSKKYAGESSYTPGTVSSYEFIMENSWPQTIANYTSGVVMLLSIFGGPLGLLRNATFSMTTTGFALASLVAVAADTWNKSEYEDLEFLDYTDLIIGAGTLGFDIVKSLKLAKLLSKMNAQDPQFVEAVMKSIDNLENKQQYWDVFDNINNIAGLWKSFDSGNLGAGDYYTAAQILYAMAGYGKKIRNKIFYDSELLNKVQSRQFEGSVSFENTITLNKDGASVVDGNQEFYQAIGLFSELQIKKIKENLMSLPNELRQSFLQNFGKGTDKNKFEHYVLLEKMSHGELTNFKSEVEKVYGNIAIPMKKVEPPLVDLSKVYESGENVRKARENNETLIGKHKILENSVKQQKDNIIELEKNLELQKTKVDSAKNKFEEAEKAFQDQKKIVDEQKSSLDESEKEIDLTKDGLVSKEEEFKSKGEDLDEIERGLSSLEKTMDDVSNEIKVIRENINDLDKSKDSLKKSKEILDERLSKIKDEISGLESKIPLKDVELHLASLEANYHSSQITLLDGKLEKLNTSLFISERIKLLEEQIDNFNKLMARGKGKGKGKGLTGEEGMEKSKMGKELARLKIEQKRDVKSGGFKQGSIEELKVLITQTKSQLDESRLNYSQSLEQVTELKRSLESMKTNFEELNIEQKTKTEESTSAMNEISDLSVDIKSKETELIEKQNNAKVLGSNLENAINKQKSVSNEVLELEEKIKEIEVELASQQKDHLEAKEKLDREQEHEDDLSKNMKKAEEHHENLSKEHLDMQKDVNDAIGIKDAAVEELSSRKLKIEQMKAEKTQLEEQHKLQIEAHHDAFVNVVQQRPSLGGWGEVFSVLKMLQGYQFKRAWELGKELSGNQAQLVSDEEYTAAISNAQTIITDEISHIRRDKTSLLMKLRDSFVATLKTKNISLNATLNSLQNGKPSGTLNQSKVDLQFQLNICEKWQMEMNTMEFSSFEKWIETNATEDGTESEMKALITSFQKENHDNFDKLKFYSKLSEVLVDIYHFTVANYGQGVQK